MGMIMSHCQQQQFCCPDPKVFSSGMKQLKGEVCGHHAQQSLLATSRTASLHVLGEDYTKICGALIQKIITEESPESSSTCLRAQIHYLSNI